MVGRILRLTAPFPANVTRPTSDNAVNSVILRRPGIQMVWIYARSVVAVVTDQRVSSYRPAVDQIRKPVRQNPSAGIHRPVVALIGPSPKPAAAIWLRGDIGVESINQRARDFGESVRSRLNHLHRHYGGEMPEARIRLDGLARLHGGGECGPDPPRPFPSQALRRTHLGEQT